MIGAKVTFVLEDADLERLVNSPDGPVAKELIRLGARIESEAKQLLSGEMVNVDTGRLRSSTTHRLFRQGRRIGVAIGSGVDYSRHLHEGTRYIRARPYLVVAARRAGIRL